MSEFHSLSATSMPLQGEFHLPSNWTLEWTKRCTVTMVTGGGHLLDLDRPKLQLEWFALDEMNLQFSCFVLSKNTVSEAFIQLLQYVNTEGKSLGGLITSGSIRETEGSHHCMWQDLSGLISPYFEAIRYWRWQSPWNVTALSHLVHTSLPTHTHTMNTQCTYTHTCMHTITHINLDTDASKKPTKVMGGRKIYSITPCIEVSLPLVQEADQRGSVWHTGGSCDSHVIQSFVSPLVVYCLYLCCTLYIT